VAQEMKLRGSGCFPKTNEQVTGSACCASASSLRIAHNSEKNGCPRSNLQLRILIFAFKGRPEVLMPSFKFTTRCTTVVTASEDQSGAWSRRAAGRGRIRPT
jgi:hypothetical protein